jgi:hypothetical protein
VLVVAFIGLILTSVSYAVMAGGTAPGGRAATEEMIAGASFGLCTLLLIYAIVLVLDAAEDPHIRALKKVAEGLRAIVVIFVVPITVGYVYLGAADYERVRFGDHHGWTGIDSVGVALVLTELCFGVALLIGPLPRRRRWRGHIAYGQAVGRFSLYALGVLITTSAAFGFCEGALDVCGTSAPVAIHLLLVLVAGVMGLVSWNVTRKSVPVLTP